MKAKDMHVILTAILEQGNGELEVFGVVGSSGVSYEASIGSGVKEMSSEECIEGGPLEELDEGTKYIQLYLGN